LNKTCHLCGEESTLNYKRNIAVVIPCYKVKSSILSVLNSIGSDIDKIYVIDDSCPEGTGKYVETQNNDSRVSVLYHDYNKGVGGAVITGYKKSLEDLMSIIVKIDGDGQMNAELISNFIRPLINGTADYTKGNRFFDLNFLSDMPFIRIFGNSILSFVNKLTSGYWNIMDPTNGYTAVHSKILHHLPLDKIDNRYFFESDMLFRLGTIRAVVQDIPLVAVYGEEKSNLNIFKITTQFPLKYIKIMFKRIFYSYFLRDFNIASVELMFGLILFFGGSIYGSIHWYESYITNVATSSGVIMLAALPVILGFQLLLSALNYDINNTPDKVIHTFL